MWTSERSIIRSTTCPWSECTGPFGSLAVYKSSKGCIRCLNTLIRKNTGKLKHTCIFLKSHIVWILIVFLATVTPVALISFGCFYDVTVHHRFESIASRLPTGKLKHIYISPPLKHCFLEWFPHWPLNNKALNTAHRGVITPHACSSVCICSSTLFPHNMQQGVVPHIMQYVYSCKVTYSLLTQVSGIYCSNNINKSLKKKGSLFAQQPSKLVMCWQVWQACHICFGFSWTSWFLFQPGFFYWISTKFSRRYITAIWFSHSF